jgi:hypothetical protein
VLGWDSVEGHDPPDGWLIFKLPPAELGVHPGDTPQHEFTLMCDDLNSTMAELGEKGIEFRGEPRDQGFGIVTTILLPGGHDSVFAGPHQMQSNSEGFLMGHRCPARWPCRVCLRAHGSPSVDFWSIWTAAGPSSTGGSQRRARRRAEAGLVATPADRPHSATLPPPTYTAEWRDG